LHYVVHSGLATHYKDSRNGLVGPDFSTKLSGYLALGCLTARQVHEKLAGFEDGTNDQFKSVEGFGAGENQGTSAIRFELLWRDYMRLCSRKFKSKLFRLKGFWDVEGEYKRKWKTADPKRADKEQVPGPAEVEKILERIYRGTTGFGLVDASMREIFHTGYTANRARQNVASFLTRRLGIDWRYGAEWYEMLLIDYDVSSNWANWQYVAGIGNDPKETRVFNPVKQAFEYDPSGDYVRMWVPELAGIEKLENLFQVSTTSTEEVQRLGLTGMDMVEKPVERITYYVDRKPPKRGDRFSARGQRGGPSGGGFSVGGGRPVADAPPGAPRGPRRSGLEGHAESRQRDNDGVAGGVMAQSPPAGPLNRGRRGGSHVRNCDGNGNGIDHSGSVRPSRGSLSNRRSRGYRGPRGSPHGGFSGPQYLSHGGSDFPYYPGHVQTLPFPAGSGHVGLHWVMPHPGHHM
jgi:deoxyribodipyrimidine photo-lyase